MLFVGYVTNNNAYRLLNLDSNVIIEYRDVKLFENLTTSEKASQTFTMEDSCEENSSKAVDYFDTYTPVARIITIRLLFALASLHYLFIHQMDVKTAFLNGDLDEEVHMEQPEGFVLPKMNIRYASLLNPSMD